MTEAATNQTDGFFKINLTAEEDRILATVLFEGKGGLASSFASQLKLQQMRINNEALSFVCTRENYKKAQDVFKKLSGAKATGQHVDKELIRKFVSSLNTDNLSTKFQAAN